MKRDFIFGIAAAFALAGLAAGCSTRDTDAGASGTGSLQLKVSATRAEGSAAGTGYDPLTDQQIRIYNNDGKLLRHYTAETLPERLELLNAPTAHRSKWDRRSPPRSKSASTSARRNSRSPQDRPPPWR